MTPPPSARCSTAPGLYRQAFYDNFPDKETCYLEAFDAGVARLEARALDRGRRAGRTGRAGCARAWRRCWTSSTPNRRWAAR